MTKPKILKLAFDLESSSLQRFFDEASTPLLHPLGSRRRNHSSLSRLLLRFCVSALQPLRGAMRACIKMVSTITMAHAALAACQSPASAQASTATSSTTPTAVVAPCAGSQSPAPGQASDGKENTEDNPGSDVGMHVSIVESSGM